MGRLHCTIAVSDVDWTISKQTLNLKVVFLFQSGISLVSLCVTQLYILTHQYF